ncbi:MAG: hypothetical protein QOH13_2309 [Thermoleophilaceae bacterium]|jgi:hypothetical protein|nr:hypothetical protein [Thermoleophilaceae bacterium]
MGAGSDPGLATPTLAPPDESAARADLRRQISRLESALCAAVVEARGTAVAARPAARHGGPRLTSLADLERVRDDLLTRLDLVRDRAHALEAHHARARSLLEAMYAHPADHKWTRITRDDLGLQGCGHYHVRPKLGLVGLLRGWWVVKVSSGCPLAT